MRQDASRKKGQYRKTVRFSYRCFLVSITVVQSSSQRANSQYHTQPVMLYAGSSTGVAMHCPSSVLVELFQRCSATQHHVSSPVFDSLDQTFSGRVVCFPKLHPKVDRAVPQVCALRFASLFRLVVQIERLQFDLTHQRRETPDALLVQLAPGLRLQG